MTPILRISITAFIISLALLTGCVSRSAPKVNYFSLLSMEQMGETQALAKHTGIRLGIGPVEIPEFLRRSQIATRKLGNQFEFDEYNRWAGELEEDLALAVGNNLGTLLGVKSIDYYPWLQHFVPDYRVVIGIQRLDGELGGEAVLHARWSVTGPDGRTQLAGNRSVFRSPTTEPGYAGLVQAESRLVADLSREIAAAVEREIGK